MNLRQFPGAPSSLRSVAGLEDVLDESCGSDVDDELVPEFDDDRGTTRGTTLSVLQMILFSLLVNRGFWPLVHSQVYLRVLRRAFQVIELQACPRVFALLGVDDSVQYIGSQGETRGKENTSCSWKKFSEFNSLESSDSVQHNEGDQGAGDPGQQPDNRRKCVASTVAHQSVLVSFHLSLSQDSCHASSSSVLDETGLAQSRLFFGGFFPRIVFARQPITMCLNVNPSQSFLSGADCGAANCFPKSFTFHVYSDLLMTRVM